MLALILTTALGYAGDFKLLNADYVGMEYSKILYLRDPYMPEYTSHRQENEEQWRYGAAALVDLHLIQYKDFELYWNNRVHMDATGDQVRHVGWYWEFGSNLGTEKLDVFYRHHSRHVMEDINEDVRFPVRDEYTVRFNLLGDK